MELRFFSAPAGRIVRLPVDVAVTEAARRRGLQGVARLPFGRGLLLWYPDPRVARVWMAGVVIPLDLVFLRPDWTVAHVVAGAPPGDPTPRGVTAPVAGVLEVAGHTAGRLGLVPEVQVYPDF